MKRNSELLAKILKAIEADAWTVGVPMKIEGHDEREVAYHVYMLGEAGLLKVADFTMNDGFPKAIPIAMTNMGHDFLEAARDDTLWNKLKDRFGGVAVDMTLEVIRRWVLAP